MSMSRLGDQEYSRLNGSCYNPYGPASESTKALADQEKLTSAAEKDSCSDTSRTCSSSPPWVPSGAELYGKDAIAVGSGIGDNSSSGGEGSGGGKKEKSSSESGNSSSGVASRSGNVGGGGGSLGGVHSDGRAGNGRSGSYESEDDRDGDGDEKKRTFGHRGDRDGGGGGGRAGVSSNGSKEPTTKSKLQEEDDEATDSADEGEGEEDTPNSMIMDFNPPSIPQSNHSSASEGGSILGPSRGAPSSQFTSGGFTMGSRSNSSSSSNGGGGGTVSSRSGLRGPVNASGANHYEESGRLETSSPLLSTPLRVKSPPEAGRSGTIAVESMAAVETTTVEQSNSAISMIVGYGMPAASVPQQSTENKSLPGSELGTPTLDSPSPLGEEKIPGMPLAIPMATTPILSPAISLLPQV